MTLDDVFHWQRYLGEDSGRRLDEGTLLVAGQLLQSLGIVGNLVELKHLLGSVEAVVGVARNNAVVAMRILHGLLNLPVELQLSVPDVGHVSDTAGVLDVESRAYVVEEAVVRLEVLRMLHVSVHDVGTVVLVGLSVSCLVRPVEIDSERLGRALAQVVGGAGKFVVLANPSALEGIIVGVIFLVFRHRLAHLVCRHLHGCQRVAVDGFVGNQQEAGVCLDISIVCIADILQCVERER